MAVISYAPQLRTNLSHILSPADELEHKIPLRNINDCG